MAEARCAVEPHPSLHLDAGIDPKQPRFQAKMTHKGVSIFIPAPRFILRGLIRFLRRSQQKVHQAFIPLPSSVAFTVIFTALTLVLNSKSTSSVRNSWWANFIWNVDSFFPWSKNFTTQQRVAYLTVETSVGVVCACTAFHRMLLKGLLSYMGYMDEGRGKKSMTTTIWGMLLKYIYVRGSTPSTFAYQSCLPHWPLPDVKDTCERYLASMEPILEKEEFEELKRETEQFQKNEAPKLQSYLKWARWFKKNYVADWWLDVVYLRGRDSIMINSNYFGLAVPKAIPTRHALDRAAYIIMTMARAKVDIDREKIQPTLLNNMIPLCMAQYNNIFSMNREPGVEADRLTKYTPYESGHVVVTYKGHLYKVLLFSSHTGRLLSAEELYATLQGIVNSAEESTVPPEADLPALTTMNRTKWAEVRKEHFLMNRTNRASLAIVESAMFFVVLDTEAYESNTDKGRQALHNDGSKIWMDKSMTVVFDSAGDWSVNGEHAWGDAPAGCHMVEYCIAYEVQEKPYDENGHLKPSGIPPKNQRHYSAERLPWKINGELKGILKEAKESATKQIADLDLHSDRFSDFGKPRVTKALKCSPDAFIQVALQLAFFRDQGKFVQTYESGMARLYLEGRTETIRSQSKEACEFVRAMDSPTATREEKLALLRKACEQHSRTTALAMSGRGVDRHLFALYVVAVGTNTDSSFLQKLHKRGWKLSTSQIVATQAPYLWNTGSQHNEDIYERPCGGFGPIADDGYGICYAIAGTKAFHFHVTAKNSCEKTNAKEMHGRISQALRELSALVPEEKKSS